MPLELLDPAHVEPAVLLGHVEDHQLEDLALLDHGQTQLGPREALGVVAIETGLAHVDAGDQQLLVLAVGAGGEEGPADHGQGAGSAPLGDHAGQRDVVTLRGHREGGGAYRDVDGRADIWRRGGDAGGVRVGTLGSWVLRWGSYVCTA